MKLHLGSVTLDAGDVASQGNAILGIRDSGKTWAAILMAEKLMTAGIPIIAFDPIGRWRHLGTPGAGKGFPIVVAGGEHGDLPLTPESAPEIVRAAMRERVSLVLDLYSMTLSKADWKRIVARSIAALLYENKAHGLRHVFLEEAAEFVPQIMPKGESETGKAYDQIERLARMGGNALLGYTLINQRAEQVNKAVLELCDNLMLFRQKGKNSLTSLSKWLDIGSASQGKEIIASLPTLPQGTCWVWAAGTDHPVKVKMSAIQTFSPDRRAQHASGGVMPARVDVGKFVAGMKGALEKVIAEAAENDPRALKAEIAKLKREMAAGVAAGVVREPDPALIDQARIEGYASGKDYGLSLGRREGFNAGVAAIKRATASADPEPPEWPVAAPLLIPIRNVRAAVPPLRVKQAPMQGHARATPPTASRVTDGLNGPQQRILDALAWWKSAGVDRPSRVQVAVASRYSPEGGAFQNPLGALRTSGHIEYPSPGIVMLTDLGHAAANQPDAPATTAELHERLRGILNGPQWRVLAPAIDAYPQPISRADLAAAAGYEPFGGAFQNPLGSLRSLGLLDYPASGQVIAADLLFLAR